MRMPQDRSREIECEAQPGRRFLKKDGLRLGWGWPACTGAQSGSRLRRRRNARGNGIAPARLGHAGHRTESTPCWAPYVGHHSASQLEKVEVVLGDTNLPTGPSRRIDEPFPVPAALEAAAKQSSKLLESATKIKGSQSSKRSTDDLELKRSRVRVKTDQPHQGRPVRRILRQPPSKSSRAKDSRRDVRPGQAAKFSMSTLRRHTSVEVMCNRRTQAPRQSRAPSSTRGSSTRSPAGGTRSKAQFVMGVGWRCSSRKNPHYDAGTALRCEQKCRRHRLHPRGCAERMSHSWDLQDWR